MDYTVSITQNIPEIDYMIEHKEPELQIATELADSSQLFQVIRSNFPWLRLLSLEHQRISSQFAYQLGQSLCQNSHLDSLVLSFSTIEPTALDSVLKNLPVSLKHLDLSNNDLSDVSETLCNLIASSETLLALNVSKNSIESGGFGRALERNTTLQDFNMSFNPLSKATVMEILESLDKNTSVRDLDISGIGVDSSVITKLSQVLQTAKICSLSIDLDHASVPALKALENTLLNSNSDLKSLNSPNIDWSFVDENSELENIHKAVLANEWIINNFDKTEQQEKDSRIAAIIEDKINSLRQSVEYSLDTYSEEIHSENNEKFEKLVEKYESLVKVVEKQNIRQKELERRLDLSERKFKEIEQNQTSLNTLVDDIGALRHNQTHNRFYDKLDRIFEMIPKFDDKFNEIEDKVAKIMNSINQVKVSMQEIEHNQSAPPLLKKTNKKSESFELKLTELVYKDTHARKKYCPGQAESKVVSSIIETVNKAKQDRHEANYYYKNLSPLSQKDQKIELLDIFPSKDT